MFSIFNAIRRQINQHKQASQCISCNTGNQHTISIDINGEKASKGPSKLSVPASRPSTPTTSVKQVLPARPTINKSNKPSPARENSSFRSKLHIYFHIEPVLVYWLIAAMLILTGYNLAAFIPIILCSCDGLQRELWLVGAINPWIMIVITRDFWIITISTLLILLGNCASGLWLLFFGTLSPKPRLDQNWVTAEVASTTKGFHGCIFVAAAAVMLLIQGWKWVAGILVAYGVLTLPLPPGWNMGFTSQKLLGH